MKEVPEEVSEIFTPKKDVYCLRKSSKRLDKKSY